MRNDVEIYCVSLARAQDRRAAMAAQAAELGLEIRIVEAIAGGALEREHRAGYRALLRRLAWRAGLTPNEIACVQSHRRALTMFLAGDAAFTVVLEDDAELAPDFAAALDAAIGARTAWEILRLECRTPDRPAVEIETLAGGRRLVLREKWTLGAAAVLYRRAAAERILAATERFFEAWDNAIGRPWSVGGPILELDPPPASERHGESTLETSHSRAPARLRRERIWWRAANGLYRRIAAPRAVRRFRRAAGPERRGETP